MLFVERIKAEHDRSMVKKAINFTTALSKHQCCGAFLHFMRELERTITPEDYKKAFGELKDMFLRGYLDPDLEHILQTQFPPGDMKSVSSIRQETNMYI